MDLGNITITESYGGTGYTGNAVGYYGWPYTTGYCYTILEPTTCIGKAHVFECDHVTACQCGKVKRVMPREKKAGKK